jgi:hypothetical protein
VRGAFHYELWCFAGFDEILQLPVDSNTGACFFLKKKIYIIV